jgi:iron(III) transport system permease protein
MRALNQPVWWLWLAACVGFFALPWNAWPDSGWFEVWFSLRTQAQAINGWHYMGLLWQGAHAPSLGVGALVSLTAVLLLLATAWAKTGGAFKGDAWTAGAVVLIGALLLVFVAYPVGSALSAAWRDDQNIYGLNAGWARLSDNSIWNLSCLRSSLSCGVAWNTLWLSTWVALGTSVLGTLMALLAARTGLKQQGWPQKLLKLLALAPIITPPFVVGLGLILLFGRAGIVNQLLEWAWGIEPTRWFYGALGIGLAQMFAFTPIAYLMMRGVLQGISPSLEEASQTLGASRAQVFWTVTLPLLKPGLVNAFLIGFIESMADFGNPIVVGGSYSVLSTDIFFAIVGAQFDPGRAAGLAWLLTLFAFAVFALQRMVMGRQSFTTVSGKGDAGLSVLLPQGLTRVTQGIAIPWLALTFVIYVFAFIGGFVKTWGRDYTLSLQHFEMAFGMTQGDFGWVWSGTAWNSLWTTLELSAVSAPLTALLGLLIAWVLARQKFWGKRFFEFSTLLAFAIPGTVLGVSYVVAFNVPPIELTGTGTLIVLCFMFRNLPVGVRSGVASFEQLDKSLEEASSMLRASTWQTLQHVVLPLLRPALLTALLYSFVRSMTTVSAVIFLVTAENDLATTYIIGRVGNGDYGVALAYCTVLMVLMSLAVWGIQKMVGERELGRRVV